MLKNKIIHVLAFVLLSSHLIACNGTVSSGSAEGTQSDQANDNSNAEIVTEETALDLIDITGVYYGDITSEYNKDYYPSIQGLTDCIVTFDFKNDDLNRTMPDTEYANTSAIKLIVGPNEYKAFKDVEYIEVLDRYSTMSHAIGYGNILGGSDPIKMFAVFFVNPNDLTTDCIVFMRNSN
ncbi:MAG: hypothetical protein IKE28_06015 [Solobacterium sp.]|nr:hypothetical protein [Solobacterium sp.]